MVWLSGGSRDKREGDDDEKPKPDNCPNYVFSNGTIVEKCENDPSACVVCTIKTSGNTQLSVELRYINALFLPPSEIQF